MLYLTFYIEFLFLRGKCFPYHTIPSTGTTEEEYGSPEETVCRLSPAVAYFGSRQELQECIGGFWSPLCLSSQLRYISVTLGIQICNGIGIQIYIKQHWFFHSYIVNSKIIRLRFQLKTDLLIWMYFGIEIDGALEKDKGYFLLRQLIYPRLARRRRQ